MELVVRQLDYWVTTYRRTWKGSVVSSFVMPLLFLSAMGIGLGGYVDDSSGPRVLAGVSYLAFIAPGLLATTAMQTAVFESSFAVFGKFKWNKVYSSMTATPLRVVDVLNGNLLYVGFRLATTCAVFLLVLAAFGVAGSVVGALGALLSAVLVGLACTTPVFGYSAWIKTDSSFAVLFRLGLIPMFLFSGAFFPVEQMPDTVEWLAYLTPVWHGVELCRGFTLGTGEFWPGVGHVTYLLVWVVVGWLWARKAFQRRLVEGSS